nr:MAG TPA: hypothetical protein [Caudoviricetes sp.]
MLSKMKTGRYMLVTLGWAVMVSQHIAQAVC